jgi:hypothetical protein
MSESAGLIDCHPGLTPDELRQRVFAAEAIQKTKPQVELKVVHYFSHDVVAREVHIPAGTDVTGAVHKYSNLNTLSQGTMLLATEQGWVEVSAPYTVVSPPGTKRAARALTDCIWTTYLGTDETDVAKIEQAFTTNSEQEYLEHAEVLKLKGI